MYSNEWKGETFLKMNYGSNFFLGQKENIKTNKLYWYLFIVAVRNYSIVFTTMYRLQSDSNLNLLNCSFCVLDDF